MKNMLKRIRESRELTQSKVAIAANITLRGYQNLEKGVQAPNVYTALAIAKNLDTTVESIWGGKV